MSSKFFIYAIILFEYISIWCSCNGDNINIGINPNVTGLTPIVSIPRMTSLYGADINMSLTVYERPVNDTFEETLRVLSGSTNVDSTNRCIVYGVSFQLWGPYPIINSQATGNGGCDAILGSECSQSIRNALQQSFGNISGANCGMGNLDFFSNPPQGCPSNSLNTSMPLSLIFLTNGSYMIYGSSPTDSSKAWIYDESDPSVNGDYDELMEYFVFTFFAGQSYTSETIDTAIACFSINNITGGSDITSTTTLTGGSNITSTTKSTVRPNIVSTTASTVGPNIMSTTASFSSIATQISVSGNVLHFLSLFIILLNIVVY